MNTIVISYSYTGNNQIFAKSVAEAISAEHIMISEEKKRSMGTIVFDIIFNKTPKVKPAVTILDQYNMIIFFGPVWMGAVATPLRSFLKYLKKHPCKYAFVSISGGADNSNPKLMTELIKRTGIEPAALMDRHIADLLPKDLTPTRQDTSTYHITDSDVKSLTDSVVEKIKNIVLQ
jgi:hypothetical protein